MSATAENRYVPAPNVRVAIVATFTLQFLLLHHLSHAWNDQPGRLLVVAYTLIAAMPVWLAVTLSQARQWIVWVVALITAGLLAGLGWHAAGRCSPALNVDCSPVLAPYILLLPAALLVAAVLVRSLLICDAGWRRWPDYHVLYREAWQVGLALIHAAVVTGVAWLLLIICGQLFHLIGVESVRTLLSESLFIAGFTGFSFGLGVAVWLSLVRAVESVRQVILGMAYLLMPLAAVIVICFTVAVLITGPARLFEAYEASGWMLSIATAVLVLYNGIFQDGQRPETPSHWSHAEFWLRHAALVALIPVMGLVAYGLGVRVQAYGWTIARVYGALFAGFIALYVLGYLLALTRRRVPTGVQRTNQILAVAFVLLALALLSPLANPSAIAARSQLARIQSGDVPLADADFHYLRHRAGSAGYRAWQTLGEDSRIQQDDELLARWQQPVRIETQPESASDDELAELYRRWIAEINPPTALLNALEFRSTAARCSAATCWLRPATIPSSPPTDIWVLLRTDDSGYSPSIRLTGEIFQRADDSTERWQRAGFATPTRAVTLSDLPVTLEQDRLRTVPKDWPDLTLGDLRLETRAIWAPSGRTAERDQE